MADLIGSLKDAFVGVLQSLYEPIDTHIEALESLSGVDTAADPRTSIARTNEKDVAHILLDNIRICEGTITTPKDEVYFLIPASTLDAIETYIQLGGHVSAWDWNNLALERAVNLYDEAKRFYHTIASDESVKEEVRRLVSSVLELRNARSCQETGMEAAGRTRSNLAAERDQLATLIREDLGFQSGLPSASPKETSRLRFFTDPSAELEIDRLGTRLRLIKWNLRAKREAERRADQGIANAKIFEINKELKSLIEVKAKVDDQINRARAPTSAFDCPEIPPRLREERDSLMRSIAEKENEIKVIKAGRDDLFGIEVEQANGMDASYDPRGFLGRRGSN